MSKHFLIALAWMCASLCGEEAARNIVHAPLDPRSVFRLPVAVDRITTLYFPGRISGLESAFVTSDGEPPARFQCTFLPGQRYFSVRAVQTNASANINVVWNGGVFVFELIPSPNPVYALVLSSPGRSDSSWTDLTVAVPTVGLGVAPTIPNVFYPVLPSTDNSPTRRWTPAKPGAFRGIPNTSPERGRPPTIVRGSPSIPSQPVVGLTGSRASTNKVSSGTSDKRETKEHWWSRWHVPYLIKITINTSPNRNRRP